MHLLYLVSVITTFRLAGGSINFKIYMNHSNTNIVPNSYIVSLKPGSHLKRGFASPHAELYHDLSARGIAWEPDHDRVGCQAGSPEDLAKLAQARGVESIALVRTYPPPKPVLSHVVNTRGYTPLKRGFSSHWMTGVDKLHRLGYYGQGIKVGIIDTGVDYTHPALGGKLGEQYKVVGGYNFVGDGYTGDPRTIRPSNDPIDRCNGHGTHVAGIVAASPKNPYGISGVAYHARINAYRVFGCNSETNDELVIAALIRAHKDGNDVINLSLGGPGGWTWGMSAVVANRIAKAGRIITASAGNSGIAGAWYTASVSDGVNVMSVGSIDNIVTQAHYAVVSNGHKILYENSDPLSIPPNLPLYASGSEANAPADACNSLPNGTPDLSNRLVIIHLGGCAFVEKIKNAGTFGARFILFYGNTDRPLSSLRLPVPTIALISRADGHFLASEGISKGLTVSFPNKPLLIKDPNAGLTSYFSTYGPTYDLHLKPALSGPGGHILSTWPVALGQYSVQSGTSMSAPYVAGAAALWLQIKGKSAGNAWAALGAFQNTARPVKETKARNSLLQTAAQQGAGVIQVYDAIRTTGRMYPAELLLNDTMHFKGRYRVFIQNRGRRGVIYTLYHQPAGTAQTINGIENNLGPVPLVSSSARVWAPNRRVHVPPGWTVPVTVWFKPPLRLNPKTFPVYSGYIRARGSDGSMLQSSYLGIAASMKMMKVIDNTAAWGGQKLPALLWRGKPMYSPTTYTFKNGDVPGLIFRLVAGTPTVQIDLIDSKSTVRPNQWRSNESHSLDSHNPPESAYGRRYWGLPCPRRGCRPGGTFARVKTVGLLAQQDSLSRNLQTPPLFPLNAFTAMMFPQFANGSEIPNGSYKLMLRALKIAGDRSREEDYEVWIGPMFNIRRA